jgi:2-iminobutanoate/2-iminopropanoate deaminase
MIVRKPISNKKVLNEAYHYEKPSAFSRGLRIEMNGTIFLFISGTASIDDNGATVHKGDFKKQTERTYFNIKNLLESEGATWNDVVKTTVYIKDISEQYEEFNKIRLKYFSEENVSPYPASVGIQATLCREDLLVEMDAIAILNNR